MAELFGGFQDTDMLIFVQCSDSMRTAFRSVGSPAAISEMKNSHILKLLFELHTFNINFMFNIVMW